MVQALIDANADVRLRLYLEGHAFGMVRTTYVEK